MEFRKTLIAVAVTVVAGQASAASMMASPVAFSAQEKTRLVSTLNSERSKHGLDVDHGFAIASQHPGEQGKAVSRVNHTYKGVRIFESESVVVTDQGGNVLSESIGERRKGLSGKRFDVKPTLSDKDAIVKATKNIPPTKGGISPPLAELVIFPILKSVRAPGAENKADDEPNAADVLDVVDRYELAYHVKTRVMDGANPVFYDTIVSARDGRILDQWNMLQNVVGTGHSQYNGTVPINTTLSGGVYKMIDGSRGTGGAFGAMAITNANHTTSAGQV